MAWGRHARQCAAQVKEAVMALKTPQNARIPGKPRIRVQPKAVRAAPKSPPGPRRPLPPPPTPRVVFSDWAAI